MKVVGLDLSLTSTGVASSDLDSFRITTKAKDPFEERLRIIANRIATATSDADLVVIEEVPTHGAFSIAPLGKVHGAVLYKMEAKYLYVTPPVLKKYATGKGNANKDVVLANAIRRFDFAGSSNDEADAWILMHIGMELMGSPLVKIPDAHKDKGWRTLEETV